MSQVGYQKYRPSGIEWLGEIPEHWEVRRLKTVARFGYGDSLADDDRIPGQCPVYGSNGIVGEHDRANTKGPCLIIGRKGSFGKVAYSDKPCFAIDTTYFIDDRFSSNDLRWLYYCLQWLRLDSFSKDSAVPGLSREDAYNKVLAFCSSDEQCAIATFLDRETARIDTLIQKKQRQIELLQEKRSALISHAVTKGLDPNAKMKDSGIEWLGEIPEHWEVRKIKHLTTKIGSGKTPRGGSEVYVDSGVMLFRSQNIHFNGLRLKDVVFIDEDVDAEMANTRVRAGDVLLNITGASLGRCCMVGDGIDAANVNQHVCIIRARHSAVVPEFLCAVMCSYVAQSQIFASENGTSREGLNFQQVGNLIVIAPPQLGEQEAIAHHIHTHTGQIDAVIGKVLHSINRLRELRTALISAAVTGKIDIRKEVA